MASKLCESTVLGTGVGNPDTGTNVMDSTQPLQSFRPGYLSDHGAYHGATAPHYSSPGNDRHHSHGGSDHPANRARNSAECYPQPISLEVWPRIPPKVRIGAGLDSVGAIPIPLRLNLIRLVRVDKS